ncbi:PPE protein [Segniliparus rotundus DSM 44985]|uniref:PPE protein n=1 Tax=Segniliparus rotundus (strain ATCC BAA-972 / CDC 1076 / CIP 108378 / DSM 44985 / JCM 13578) TaxID=640132 RepID=D6ZBI1_SEGRD|nr:PPE domain-containing protein [Segniliparus rotundus]ADG98933.1 PPE protein [Segniliparus rotundus DSM 44985]
MALMDATGLLPEWLRALFDGNYAKSVPMTTASMAWVQMGEQLEEMSAEFISVLSFLESAWQGTAAMAAVTKSMPYALWMATAGMECAANGLMAGTQAVNYETGDGDIPQLEEIVATRTALLNSYAANAAAWGMLSGLVAACEEEMERCTFQTMSGFSAYDAATQGTSVQFDFTPSPLITSIGFQSEAMFAASMAETMARAAAGVASQAVVDAILAEATAQAAAELAMTPVRMITPFAADAMGLLNMAQGNEHAGLSERIHQDLAHSQEKKAEAKGHDGMNMGQQVMQIGQQVGQGVMQGVQQMQQMGQQAVQQGGQVVQQGVQQGQQIGQQIMQMASQHGGGHAASSFANPALTGQYASGYSSGFGGAMTSPMGSGSASGIRVPSGWGGSAPSLGLGAPAMTGMKLDAGSTRGALSTQAAAGSSLSGGGSGSGMGGGVQGVAQAAARKQTQEELDEEQDRQYQIPDQFADGRVVTPPVIGASEKARA